MATIDAFRWVPFLLLPVLAPAQSADSLDLRHRSSMEGTGAFDSNVLSNDMVLPLLFGGTLSRDTRQRSLDAIQSTGRGGIELGGRASVTWGNRILAKDAWRMRTSLGWQYALGARFGHDAFAVAFLGNAAYENGTAHLAPLRFDQWHYQSIGIGIEDARSGSFLELAYVNGTSLNMADVRRADLFTAEDGRYLDLYLAGDYRRSDTSASTGFTNGSGAALNAKWAKAIKLFGTPARFSVEVMDAGFISWNGNSVTAISDSAIHFEGIAITDVFNLDGPLIDRTRLQDSLGLGFERGPFTRPLPGRAQAVVHFGKRRKAGYGKDRSAYLVQVDQRWLPGYIPKAQAKRSITLGKALTLDVGAGYGGFGGLRALAGIELVTARGLSCSIATANALGAVSDRFNGRSIEFKLQALW